jgi:hypothetical protein
MARKPKIKKTSGKRVKKRSAWGKMHVRHLLYKYYKKRYKRWVDTKDDAGAAIKYMKEGLFLKRATLKGIKEYIDIVESYYVPPEPESPDKPTYSFPPAINNDFYPIHYYDIDILICQQWVLVSNNFYIKCKDLWGKDIRYYGGKNINYSEAFKPFVDLCNKLRNLNVRADYETDWFVRFLTPEYNKAEGLWYSKLIICNQAGAHVRYNPDGTITEIEEKPVALPPKAPPPEEKPPIEPPGAMPPEEKIPIERRVEIEKEKVRAEAEASAKVKIAERYSDMFERGKLTFEQYEKLMSNLFK